MKRSQCSIYVVIISCIIFASFSVPAVLLCMMVYHHHVYIRYIVRGLFFKKISRGTYTIIHHMAYAYTIYISIFFKQQ